MNIVLLFVQSLVLSTKSRSVFQKCWSKEETIIGIHRNYSYQLMFVTEQDAVELQCRECTGTSDPHDVNIYWNKVDVTLNKTDATHSLNKQTKSLEKGMKILDNTALFIKKVRPTHSGLYNCYVNSTSADFKSSLTAPYETYSYFIHVGNRKNNSSINGTYTEWNYYEDYVYKSGEKMIQSLPHINQTYKPSLIVYWSAWGNCLCGRYTYDTRSYRYAYCCVKLFHGHILPCQSSILKEIRSDVAKILENVLKFKEYRRCMEDCIPAVAEEIIDFKFQKTYYMRESSHRELKCVEPNNSAVAGNSSEIIWIRDDNVILNQSKNAFGRDSKELRVAVDSYYTLYLTDVTTSEEGYYSCVKNGLPIIKFFIRIEPSNLIFTKECGQKLVALSYVIALWIILYFIVEWIRLGKRRPNI